MHDVDVNDVRVDDDNVNDVDDVDDMIDNVDDNVSGWWEEEVGEVVRMNFVGGLLEKTLRRSFREL